MLIDPQNLTNELERLEEIEKATLRLVTRAIYEYRDLAAEIFLREGDLVADIGEDITREALDRIGTSRIDQRLFGKVDYKRARYVFHPDYAVRQALFVDSKAEKIAGQGTATLQMTQLSMAVRQVRARLDVAEQGKLPTVITVGGERYLTTTVFVKYNYRISENRYELRTVTVAALPNGMLQERYNPDATDTIWIAGRDSPKRGEDFRVRLSFSRLKAKAPWRVQLIPMTPLPFNWAD